MESITSISQRSLERLRAIRQSQDQITICPIPPATGTTPTTTSKKRKVVKDTSRGNTEDQIKKHQLKVSSREDQIDFVLASQDALPINLSTITSPTRTNYLLFKHIFCS